MPDRTFDTRRNAKATLVAALVAVASLVTTALVSTPAGAAPSAISGTASVALGLSGAALPVPQTASFTGTFDPTNGSISATVASTPLDISLPIGDDTYGLRGTLSNPTAFSGTVNGSTVTFTGGIARFQLTGLTIPGITIPDFLVTALGCTLDFTPSFTGTYDSVTGEISVSDDDITVPPFPDACATMLNGLASGFLGADFDVNSIIAALPPATATMTLELREPLATTSTSTSPSTSTTAPTTTAAPTTVAPSTTLAPTTTSAPTSTAAPSTVAPTTTLAPTTTPAPTTTTTAPTTTAAPTTTLAPTTTTTEAPTTTLSPTTTAPPPTVGPSTTLSPTTTGIGSLPTISEGSSTTTGSQVGADTTGSSSTTVRPGSTGTGSTGTAPAATAVRATPAYTG